MKRAFDLVSSFLVLLLMSPFFILVLLAVMLTSTGGPFYFQTRIGRNGIPFRIIKFRTMFVNADQKGELTVGNRDPRITRLGYFLRRSKLDELPQLINIIKGDMSVVGPRPETPKYVERYTEDQRKVLSVRPGLTDLASLEFIDENKILANYEDPEKAYISEIMPKKLELNMQYIREQSMSTDLSIIFRTIFKIITRK